MELELKRREWIKHLVVGTGVSLSVLGAGLFANSHRNSLVRERNGRYLSHAIHPVDALANENNGCLVSFTLDNLEYHTLEYEKPEIDPPYIFTGRIEGIPPEIAAQFTDLSQDSVKNGVKIITDLEQGERGYANILSYRLGKNRLFESMPTYVELHMPSEYPSILDLMGQGETVRNVRSESDLFEEQVIDQNFPWLPKLK